jgi:hypothetical protein
VRGRGEFAPGAADRPATSERKVQAPNQGSSMPSAKCLPCEDRSYIKAPSSVLNTRCAVCRVHHVHHQSSFRPNWTWRDVVDVLVIAPAVGETPEGVKTTALGRLKFARLRRLNISARN